MKETQLIGKHLLEAQKTVKLSSDSEALGGGIFCTPCLLC